jgi:hypothetical protein
MKIRLYLMIITSVIIVYGCCETSTIQQREFVRQQIGNNIN